MQNPYSSIDKFGVQLVRDALGRSLDRYESKLHVYDRLTKKFNERAAGEIGANVDINDLADLTSIGMLSKESITEYITHIEPGSPLHKVWVQIHEQFTGDVDVDAHTVMSAVEGDPLWAVLHDKEILALAKSLADEKNASPFGKAEVASDLRSVDELMLSQVPVRNWRQWLDHINSTDAITSFDLTGMVRDGLLSKSIIEKYLRCSPRMSAKLRVAWEALSVTLTGDAREDALRLASLPITHPLWEAFPADEQIMHGFHKIPMTTQTRNFAPGEILGRKDFDEVKYIESLNADAMQNVRVPVDKVKGVLDLLGNKRSDVLNRSESIMAGGVLDTVDPEAANMRDAIADLSSAARTAGQNLAFASETDKKFAPISAHEFFANHRAFDSELWDGLNPRIFKGVDQWCDPRYVSAFCAGSLGFFRHNILDDNETVESTAMREKAIAACLMYQHRMPIFFVSRELLDAAMKTRPPESIDWREMKLPHEAAAFVLPKGAIKSKLGGEVPFILYSRIEADKLYREPIRDTRVSIDIDRFMIMSMDTRQIVDFHRSLAGPYEPGRNYRTHEVQQDYHRSTQNGAATIYDNQVLTTSWEEGDEASGGFNAFNDQISNILFNLLMLMQAKPEFIDKAGSVKVGRHKKSGSELWTPNVLGRNYRVVREGPATGTHASPRWHWRSGHWREQGRGPMTCENIVGESKCGHGHATHDRDGACKMNQCLGICTSARYRHEEHFQKWIEPMQVAYKEEADD